MKQEKWAERLDKHLEGYRKSPSRDLWEGIEASLDKQEKAHPIPFISGKRSWLMAAALIGAVFTGTYLLWEKESSTGVSAPIEVTAPVVEKHEPISEREPEVESIEKRVIKSMANLREKHLPPETICSVEDSTVVYEEPKSLGLDSIVQFHNHKPAIEVTPNPSVRKKTEHRQSHIGINLYASAGTGGFSGRNGVMMSPTLHQQFTRTRGDQPYLMDYEERQSHDQPVSFGLSLSYPITNRLSVMTGVVYTKLTSDFLTLMPRHQIHRQQKLHYVGIPLNLHFRIWQWRGFSTYLSAGGQAEWNVKAEANTDGVDQEMKKDRMQWSVGGSLGLQYNFLPQFGVYAEPGIRHYFDNGSTIRNFYKDKPTNFNLQLGLRFQF